MPKLVYEAIQPRSRKEVTSAIRRNIPGELLYLVLSVALHEADQEFAESICIRFAQHEHFNVRGNAILGFSHIARIHQRLDKKLVMPLINEALSDENEYVRGHAQDVKEDIEAFLGWKFTI